MTKHYIVRAVNYGIRRMFLTDIAADAEYRRLKRLSAQAAHIGLPTSPVMMLLGRDCIRAYIPAPRVHYV